MNNAIIKLLTITLLFSIYSSAFAQDIEVHIGNSIRADKREKVLSVFPTEDGIIALRVKYKLLGNPSYAIEVLDNQMNFVSRNDLELPDKDLEFSNLMYINNKLYIFMKKYDSQNNINSLYGTTISSEGNFDSEIFEIVQVAVESRRKMNLFRIEPSADSTQFKIIITPRTQDKDQMGLRQFIILDQAFGEVDNVQINFPFKERDFSIKSSRLDPSGNIHMLCSVNIEESKRTIFKTNSETEARVFTLYKGESEIKEYTINFLNEDAGFISQIKMNTDKKGKLQCTGFYSDKKGNSTRGVFVFTIDPATKEISNSTSQAFTDEYLNQFLSEREIRKKDRKQDKNKGFNRFDRLYNYRIRNVVMKEGGGFYIVAEYYFMKITSYTDSKGNVRYTYHYYYDDLMVINVEADNEVTWYSKVPKRQYSTNDGGDYSGIVTGINKDNSLNIIFNDNMENANSMAQINTKPVKLKNSVVVLVKFDEVGNATKSPLIEADKSKMYLIPSASPKGLENNLILYSFGKNKNRFVNVILK